MQQLTLLATLLFTSIAAFASADTNEVSNDIKRSTPVPYKLAKVTKVVVTAPSQTDDDEHKAECKPFVITPKRATYFFNHARPVSERARMHDYTVSSCYAEGSIKFSNGDKATWTIVRGGTGLMTPLNGKFKDQVISLHCKKCDDMDW